jgi:hypothetical protein
MLSKTLESQWPFCWGCSAGRAQVANRRVIEIAYRAQNMSDDVLHDLYGLTTGEVIRWVQSPFIKQRRTLDERSQLTPDGLILLWKDGTLHLEASSFGPVGLECLLGFCFGIHFHEMEGDLELVHRPIGGDFVIAHDSTREQKLSRLEEVLSMSARKPVKLTRDEVERPAIVFSGKWTPRGVDGKPLEEKPQWVHVFGTEFGDTGGGGGQGDVPTFARSLGERLARHIVIEATDTPPELIWRVHRGPHLRKKGEPPPLQLFQIWDVVCNHITEQTGLAWTQSTRTVPRLLVES